jgi:hypothetical protein
VLFDTRAGGITRAIENWGLDVTWPSHDRPILKSLAVLAVIAAAPLLPASLFIRGDLNGDATLDISDPIATLLHLFGGGPAPDCRDAGDANDDGALDIADALYALDFLFRGGPALSRSRTATRTRPRTISTAESTRARPS